MLPLFSSAEDESAEPAPAPMSNKQDHLISALSGNGEVVVKAITARSLVQDALIKQDLRPLAADALGRVMICTLLCASGLKDKETLQFTFSGDGPLNGGKLLAYNMILYSNQVGSVLQSNWTLAYALLHCHSYAAVMAISDGTGGVRGYVGNGMVDYGDKHPDVSIGIGKGLLKVVRNHPDYVRPYSGIVELRNSQVAYDVAGYLRDSQQSDSIAIAAGVSVTGALVRQAAGYLIETLPGASDATIKQCALNVGKLMAVNEDPSQLMAEGLTPAAIAEVLLEGVGNVGSLTISKPEYKCHCSNERVFRALRLLGTEAVNDILAKEETVECKCEFCGMIYRLDAEQIAKELNTQT
jgi:molecular chaperone Hsp33